MPLQGEFHTFYWETSDTRAAVVHLSGGATYPHWQAAVITPSLLGMVGAWIDAHWALLVWHWRFSGRVHRLSKESRGVVLRVVDVLESPLYPSAQKAVRQTATTLGFNRPELWTDYARALKSDAGRMENVYRHLKATQLLRDAAAAYRLVEHTPLACAGPVCSTLTNPAQNLFTELAYHGFTLTRK